MRIGFLNNQIDNRGTGNAVFDYADFNERILGNESYILTFPIGNHDLKAVERYQNRFQNIYDIYGFDMNSIDAIYHIKSGYDDNFRVPVPYLVHSVFENHPHGDRYATISPWMGKRFGIPFVPHIVSLPDINTNLRGRLGIPDSAIVFGRHGGADTFDIPWVWNAIKDITEKRNDIWFLMMNTNKPDILLNNVIFIEPTANPENKRMFINTCDAMIHARSRGETFGIAVGEFAICGKPVITYLDSPEKAHLMELEQYGLYYQDERMLYLIFDTFMPQIKPKLYADYTPEKVMVKFKEVFLDGYDKRGGA